MLEANLQDMDIDQLRELIRTVRSDSTEHKIYTYRAGIIDGTHPHKKQLAFHKGDARIRLVQGSNRGGKTVSGIAECVMLCLGIHPYRELKTPVRGRIATTSFEKGVKEVVIPKLKEWTPEDQIEKWTKDSQGKVSGVLFRNGSRMDFMSYVQTFDKYEGVSLDFFYLDEAPPRDIYYAMITRIIDNNGFGFITMSPLKEPWIYDELWEPATHGDKKDVSCFEMFMEDNPFLNKEAVEFVMETMPDDEKEARVFGRWTHMMGRVFPQLDREKHVVDDFPIPADWKYLESLDCHQNKPHAVTIWALSPDNALYLIDEYELDSTIYELGHDLVERRKKRKDLKPFISMLDHSQLWRKSRETGRDLQQELSNIIGPFAKSPKQPAVGREKLLKRLDSSIQFLGESQDKFDYWKNHCIFFFKSCQKTYRQLEHYIWDAGDPRRRKKILGEIKPVAKHDDFVSCTVNICTVDPVYRGKFKSLRMMQPLPQRARQFQPQRFQNDPKPIRLSAGRIRKGARMLNGRHAN